MIECISSDLITVFISQCKPVKMRYCLSCVYLSLCILPYKTRTPCPYVQSVTASITSLLFLPLVRQQSCQVLLLPLLTSPASTSATQPGTHTVNWALSLKTKRSLPHSLVSQARAQLVTRVDSFLCEKQSCPGTIKQISTLIPQIRETWSLERCVRSVSSVLRKQTVLSFQQFEPCLISPHPPLFCLTCVPHCCVNEHICSGNCLGLQK